MSALNGLRNGSGHPNDTHENTPLRTGRGFGPSPGNSARRQSMQRLTRLDTLDGRQSSGSVYRRLDFNATNNTHDTKHNRMESSLTEILKFEASVVPETMQHTKSKPEILTI